MSIVSTKQFGPSFVDDEGDSKAFPHELRTQLWPMCCGATILSGLSGIEIFNGSEKELIDRMTSAFADYIPDFQVEGGKQRCSSVVWLILNKNQMQSEKIMSAVKAVGFKPVASNKSMGGGITYFVRDTGGTFELLHYG